MEIDLNLYNFCSFDRGVHLSPSSELTTPRFIALCTFPFKYRADEKGEKREMEWRGAFREVAAITEIGDEGSMSGMSYVRRVH